MRYVGYGLLISVLILSTGCMRKEVTVEPPSAPVKATTHHNEENTWAKETNVDESDIDTSDVEEEQIDTESNESVEAIPAKVKRVPFRPSEYRGYGGVGKATVKGKIYLVGLYDEAVVGKNTRLYLNPLTSYAKQWYEVSYLQGRKLEKPDPRLFNYLRFTASDNEGNFAFYGVPSGRYYLVGTVTCAEECGYTEPKQVRIATTVTVRGNETVEKDLTKSVTVE